MDTTTPLIVLWMAGLVLGVIGSGVFSGMETGTYVLNRIRLSLRTAAGDRRARRLSRVLDRPEEMLSALLISNNVSDYVATASAVSLLTVLGAGSPDLYTTLIVTPTMFVFGELLPKNLFRLGSEVLLYRLSVVLAASDRLWRWLGVAPTLAMLSRLALRMWHGRGPKAPPGATLRPTVTRLLAEGYAHGALTRFQSRMAERVIRTRSRRIREVMVDLPRVVSIPLNCPRERFERVVASHNFTRLAVWRGHPSDLEGIVNIYDVLGDLDAAAPPAHHVYEPPRLNHSLDVGSAMLSLQRAHQAMGLVVDDRGRCLGIVTIEDLVEEIVGDLEG